MKQDKKFKEMTIVGIASDTRNMQPVVVLREKSGERELYIWIGPVEAMALQRAMNKEVFQRPLTHELLRTIIDKVGVHFRLQLPHVAFHRQIGEFRNVEATPTGELLDQGAWQASKDQYLPSEADGAYIADLMKPETQTGDFASWIAAPKVGIDNKPGDFEYVKIAA